MQDVPDLIDGVPLMAQQDGVGTTTQGALFAMVIGDGQNFHFLVGERNDKTLGHTRHPCLTIMSRVCRKTYVKSLTGHLLYFYDWVVSSSQTKLARIVYES